MTFYIAHTVGTANANNRFCEIGEHCYKVVLLFSGFLFSIDSGIDAWNRSPHIFDICHDHKGCLHVSFLAL